MTVSVPSNFTYSSPSGGVLFWSNIAKSIRIAARRGNPYLEISSGSIIPSTTVLSNYYTGTGIVAGIILLALLFTLLSFVFEICCLLCCIRSIRAKQDRRRPSTWSTACSSIWYILCTVGIFLGAVFSFLGSYYLSNTITLASSGTVGTINNTDILLLSLEPAVNDAFSLMFHLINTTATSALNVVNTSLLVSTGVTPSLTQLANNISATDGSIQVLLGQGDNIANLKSRIQSILTNVHAELVLTQTAYNAWTTSVTLSPGSYSYNPTTPMPGGLLSGTVTASSGAITLIAQSPDGQSTIAPLGSLGLSAYATQINDIVSSLPSTIIGLVSNGTTSFTTSAVTTLTSTKQSITGSLNSTVTSTNKTAIDYMVQAQNIFTTISTFDGYRKQAMTILSALLIVIIFIIGLGLLAKKPKVAKGCNFISCPVYFFVQIFAFILLLLTFVLGDFCSLVFDYSPPPIALGLGPSLQSQIDNVFSFRDQCLQNVSMIQIAINLGYLDGSTVNLTAKATDAINGLDFSTIANSWNVSSAISLSNDPTSQLANLTTLDLSSLNTTALSNLQTTLTTLKTSVNNIITALNGMVTDVTNNAGSTISVSGGVTNAQAKSDLLTRINAEITRLQNITGSGLEIDTASALTTLITGNVTALNASTASLQTNAAAIPGSYAQASLSLNYFSTNVSANLNAFIPTVKNNVIGTVSTVQTNFYAVLNCRSLALSLDQIQDSMCGALLSGLDVVWFSYYVVGVFAFISIPSYIYFANVLQANNRSNNPQSTDSENPNPMDFDAKQKGYATAPQAQVVYTIQMDQSPVQPTAPMMHSRQTSQVAVPVVGQRPITMINLTSLPPNAQGAGKRGQSMIVSPNERMTVVPGRISQPQPPTYEIFDAVAE